MTDAEVWLRVMIAQTEREENISLSAATLWADNVLEAFKRRFDSKKDDTVKQLRSRIKTAENKLCAHEQYHPSCPVCVSQVK
jgi:vacuolar-type H+-ATPase subunit H